MDVLHFLDVGQGDCSILQHQTGRVTMIDVCKASPPALPWFLDAFGKDQRAEVRGAFGLGAIRQSEPTNPLAYLPSINVHHIHRFILTHPDMDHMDGLHHLFSKYPPANFWDTNNTKRFTPSFIYDEADWKLYMSLRNGSHSGEVRRLTLYDGSAGSLWNRPGDRGQPHDSLFILAPTPTLVAQGNACGDWNDSSYVILWITKAGRVLFWGDAHDRTREHVFRHYGDILAGVEIMIAPHHGRDSDSDREYLSLLRPKLTLFGRAPSEHLAYDAWRNRGLAYVTNAQAGNVIVDLSGDRPWIYTQNATFAISRNSATYRCPIRDAYLVGSVV